MARSRGLAALAALVPWLPLALLPGPAAAQEGAAVARLARAGAQAAEHAALPAAVRACGETGAALAARYGASTAESLVKTYGRVAAETFATHGDDGIRALRRIGPRLAGTLPPESDLLVHTVMRHGDEAVAVLRTGGPEALRVVAELGQPGLRFARLAGPEAGSLYAQGGASLVYQVLRRPETLGLLREAQRTGTLEVFLRGLSTYGDRFVVWVGSRWKQVGFVTALATFVAVAPDAVSQAGATAREGVKELGGFGVFGTVLVALAAVVAWDLARRRGRTADLR